MNPLEIGGRPVGPGTPVYVIAEIGMNHNGDMALAQRMIAAAKQAGADAVKFQSFRTARLVRPDAPDADFRRRVELSEAQHRLLFDTARSHGIEFLSTPCDESGVDLLADLGVHALKIGSFDITHLPLLEHAGATGLPVLLAVGTATLPEIATALDALGRGGPSPVVLLHCVSQYPATLEQANLATLATLRERFGLPVGWSDHTHGSESAALAVACGACVVEKHFTLDNGLPGPDQAFSADPAALADLVRRIRHVELAMGRPGKEPLPEERALAAVARRSIHSVVDIPAGAVITREMVALLRPPTGLAPSELPRVLGSRTRRAIPAWTPLQPDWLAWAQ